MDLLTLSDIADRLGVKVISVRVHHNKSTRRRREGVSLWHDIPAPSVTVGRSPRWEPELIESWIELRPGSGRPKREKKSE